MIGIVKALVLRLSFGIGYKCYWPRDHDFEDRSSILANSGSAMDQVKAAINSHLGAFTKQDIREWCPNLSDSAIEGAVRTLVKDGRIQTKRWRSFYLLCEVLIIEHVCLS